MTNVIFYLCLLLFSLFLSLIPPFLKQELTPLYLSHALCQLLVTAIACIFFDSLFRGKKLHFLWISATFFLFLLEFTHLTLARLMDSTIGYLFQFLLGGGLSNFLLAWSALNLNTWMVITILTLLIFLPIFAIFFYRLVDKPVKIPASFLLASFALSLALALALPPLNSPSPSLPWGSTLLQKPNPIVKFTSKLRPPRNESLTQENASSKKFEATHLPNIYLFIIESLRRDCINAKSAPAMDAFGKKNIYPDHTYANANSTFPSWFSIFHSDFPHHWASMRDEWNGGSIPLSILKNLGYELFIYSSADLRYFNQDSLLFGKNRRLIDEIYEPNHSEIWAKDAACIDRFEQTVRPKAQINLFFLDSTHSEYSFPPNFPKKFEPIASRIDYLTINPTNIEPIKNRYLNAVGYIDSLFDRFLKIIERNGLLEEAIIVVTGDHGEEFFEEGSLFHGTHLNKLQTNVPIIYQLPELSHAEIPSVTTHIDIFPTILHTILKRDDWNDLFDGESLFQKNRRPYRVAIHHNCASKPNEFWLQSDQSFCHFRLKNDRQIEILSGKISPEHLKFLFDESATKDPYQIDSSSIEASFLKH